MIRNMHRMNSLFSVLDKRLLKLRYLLRIRSTLIALNSMKWALMLDWFKLFQKGKYSQNSFKLILNMCSSITQDSTLMYARWTALTIRQLWKKIKRDLDGPGQIAQRSKINKREGEMEDNQNSKCLIVFVDEWFWVFFDLFIWFIKKINLRSNQWRLSKLRNRRGL